MPMQALRPISILHNPSLEPREQGKKPLDQSCLKATNSFVPFFVPFSFSRNPKEKKNATHEGWPVRATKGCAVVLRDLCNAQPWARFLDCAKRQQLINSLTNNALFSSSLIHQHNLTKPRTGYFRGADRADVLIGAERAVIGWRERNGVAGVITCQ
jgi:hypothetical protein